MRATLGAVMVSSAAVQGHVKAAGALFGAERFDDPHRARIIFLMAGGLVLLGVFVAIGTVQWWRSSKVEHPALGPLEVMGSRSWWKGDHAFRRRRLEAARPLAAEKLETAAGAEPVDLDALGRARPAGFDDLIEPPAGDVAQDVVDAPTREAGAP